jgi:enolase-phosphatase E1
VPRARLGGGQRKGHFVIVFGGKGILLDVEGTTSSISFVYDVLFAYAKQHVGEFLSGRRDDPLVRDLAGGLAATAGVPAPDLADPAVVTRIALAAIELMNRDVKDTALKALQGMIWRSGFESGELVAHVFDDVPEALGRWTDSGLDVRIYSSGSIEAQRLFFAHTAAGDLTPLLRGHYDTTTGPKREAESYARIAVDMGIAPRQILFVSDVGAELDAARQAGMATALAVRPGNREAGGVLHHESVASFAEIHT